MSETATKPETRSPTLLAEYDCDEGKRQLIGQRVKGKVRITDRRPERRSYLVDEGFTSMAHLEAVVTDYLKEGAPAWLCPDGGVRMKVSSAPLRGRLAKRRLRSKSHATLPPPAATASPVRTARIPPDRRRLRQAPEPPFGHAA